MTFFSGKGYSNPHLLCKRPRGYSNIFRLCLRCQLQNVEKDNVPFPRNPLWTTGLWERGPDRVGIAHCNPWIRLFLPKASLCLVDFLPLPKEPATLWTQLTLIKKIWLAALTLNMLTQWGIFFAYDKNGVPIFLNWQNSRIFPRFSGILYFFKIFQVFKDEWEPYK